MGRKGTGVEVRGNAIRIQFSINGEVIRRTFKSRGKALPVSPENLVDARRLTAEIRGRIKAGSFCHSEYFPATGTSGEQLTVGEHLDSWLATQRIEPSTAASYATAVRFWKGAPCDDSGAKLGDRAINRLRPSHVLLAMTSRPGLNAKTFNNYVTVLRRAMDLALADRAIEDNLVRHVRRRKQQLPLPDPFSRDEVESILSHMMAHYPPAIYNFVEFKFLPGCVPPKSPRFDGATLTSSATTSMSIARSFAATRRARRKRTRSAWCC